MEPVLIIAVGLLLAAFAYVETRRIRAQRPPHITGWWHYQHPDDGRRAWNPDSWSDACDQSLEKSRARRIDG